ncbi:MAG TPA: PAS domain-containing protein, partial [Bacteroidota bacterium]|nr:PAS domain-containing protein [Bacteroidota bacterium]
MPKWRDFQYQRTGLIQSFRRGWHLSVLCCTNIPPLLKLQVVSNEDCKIRLSTDTSMSNQQEHMLKMPLNGRNFAARNGDADELRRNEAFLAEAQRLSKTGSFGWNVFTGEIFWSEETYRIFQYDPTTKPTVELVLQRVHPEDLNVVQQAIKRASQSGKDYQHKYRLVMPDGSVKHLRVVAHAAKDKSGELEFVGAVMDITQEMQSKETVERQKTHL